MIKLRAEYCCWPLWWNDWDTDSGAGPDIDPDDLPISDELKSELREWAALFDATLDQTYPPDSGFETKEDELSFREHGARLAVRLQTELGADYSLIYSPMGGIKKQKI